MPASSLKDREMLEALDETKRQGSGDTSSKASDDGPTAKQHDQDRKPHFPPSFSLVFFVGTGVVLWHRKAWAERFVGW